MISSIPSIVITASPTATCRTSRATNITASSRRPTPSSTPTPKHAPKRPPSTAICTRRELPNRYWKSSAIFTIPWRLAISPRPSASVLCRSPRWNGASSSSPRRSCQCCNMTLPSRFPPKWRSTPKRSTRIDARRDGRRGALPCVPSMTRDLEVRVLCASRPRRALAKRKVISREAVAERSAEQNREPTNRNRIQGVVVQGERAEDREALTAKELVRPPALRCDQHLLRGSGATQRARPARLQSRSPPRLQAGLYRAGGDARGDAGGLRGVRRQSHRRDHGRGDRGADGSALRSGPAHLGDGSRHEQRGQPELAPADRTSLPDRHGQKRTAQVGKCHSRRQGLATCGATP